MFVANDWHTSLIPVYLAAKYRPHGVYKRARSILAIHNLRHQVRAWAAGGRGRGRGGAGAASCGEARARSAGRPASRRTSLSGT